MIEDRCHGSQFYQCSLPYLESVNLREGNSATQGDTIAGQGAREKTSNQAVFKVIIYQIGFSGCQLPYQICLNDYAYLWGAVSHRRDRGQEPLTPDDDMASTEVRAIQLSLVPRISEEGSNAHPHSDHTSSARRE